ncbi:ComGF family competence protein [Suicoccus acidiformans]|uniref:ComGF family competence protein n=1 Tax=Suicoccus acidiformans TaxID=2036206 RepID=UPI0013C35A57|nr:ComGF family competence protein [Suicoccus acidiformans]
MRRIRWLEKIHSSHDAAFTLVELLLGLLIFSMIMQTISMSLRTYQSIEGRILEDRSQDWHLFLNLLEAELEHYTVEGIEGGRVYLKEPQSGKVSWIELNRGRLVKRPGWQTYLMEVDTWSAQWQGEFIYLEVSLANGQTYQGHIRVGGNP